MARSGGGAWGGLGSNLRYTTRDEKERLSAIQPALGRSRAARAALIPIKKSARGGTWHRTNAAGFPGRLAPHVHRPALSPPIARRLHHSRDLGEPFDFITWFDYAPEHERDFDALLAELRASEEWTYVEREIDSAWFKSVEVIDKGPLLIIDPLDRSEYHLADWDSCNAPLCPRQRPPTTSGIFHAFLVNYVTVTGTRSANLASTSTSVPPSLDAHDGAMAGSNPARVDPGRDLRYIQRNDHEKLIAVLTTTVALGVLPSVSQAQARTSVAPRPGSQGPVRADGNAEIDVRTSTPGPSRRVSRRPSGAHRRGA